MRYFYIFIILIFFISGCSKKMFDFEDQNATEVLNFFEYRYESATPIYFEIQVIPTVSDPTFQTYELKGFASPADGSSQNIDYSVELFDSSSVSICAEKVGVFAAGDTLIEETCTINKNIQIGYALFKVKFQQGDWHVYKKVFNY